MHGDVRHMRPSRPRAPPSLRRSAPDPDHRYRCHHPVGDTAGAASAVPVAAPEATFMDLVYRPARTPWLAAAHERGIPAANGLFTARSLARMYAALADGGGFNDV